MKEKANIFVKIHLCRRKETEKSPLRNLNFMLSIVLVLKNVYY